MIAKSLREKPKPKMSLILWLCQRSVLPQAQPHHGYRYISKTIPSHVSREFRKPTSLADRPLDTHGMKLHPRCPGPLSTSCSDPELGQALIRFLAQLQYKLLVRHSRIKKPPRTVGLRNNRSKPRRDIHDAV
jgi:hypothetical protein